MVKEGAEKDLAAAQPALEAAVAALNSITPKDIVGLKALKSPPDIIKRIFDTVLLLRYIAVPPLACAHHSLVLVSNSLLVSGQSATRSRVCKMLRYSSHYQRPCVRCYSEQAAQ